MIHIRVLFFPDDTTSGELELSVQVVPRLGETLVANGEKWRVDEIQWPLTFGPDDPDRPLVITRTRLGK